MLLHGLRLPLRTPEVHVTVTGATRRHRGLVVHRSTSLDPQERVRVDGLAATSLARTLIDLAPRLGDAMLESLVDQALRGKTSRTKLREALARHPGRPGTPRLARLLDPARPSAETWSHAEARPLAAIRRAELPMPEANVDFGGYIPDLMWRAQRVALEYDSEEVHLGTSAFHSDRRRHNVLTTRGNLQVLHVTGRDATELVIVWITVALEQGGGF